MAIRQPSASIVYKALRWLKSIRDTVWVCSEDQTGTLA
jgi:hypothetical protein